VTAGALPTNLLLNATTGAITGTPTVVGTFSGTVTASNGVLPVATQAFSIVIGTLQAPPAITSAAPPATGTVGVAYNHTYTATGNPAPTYTVTAGALPTNLLLNATTGAITGTPTVVGTFSGTVTASNGVLPVATQAFSIVIGTPIIAPPLSYQGLWWADPRVRNQDGESISRTEGDLIFATWFT
jgi:hypothetical protein